MGQLVGATARPWRRPCRTISCPGWPLWTCSSCCRVGVALFTLFCSQNTVHLLAQNTPTGKAGPCVTVDVTPVCVCEGSSAGGGRETKCLVLSRREGREGGSSLRSRVSGCDSQDGPCDQSSDTPGVPTLLSGQTVVNDAPGTPWSKKRPKDTVSYTHLRAHET